MRSKLRVRRGRIVGGLRGVALAVRTALFHEQFPRRRPASDEQLEFWRYWLDRASWTPLMEARESGYCGA